jgi:CRISPR-associated protein Cmr2
MSQVDQESRFWQAKVAAWVHDPAEKALVLLRDPAGHERGTSRRMRELLFPQGLEKSLADAVREADHWAAAADRPQFPRSQKDGPYASWAQVDFDKDPQLVHPLSGDRIAPSQFGVEVEHIKAVSFDHLEPLVCRNNGGIDYRKTLLSMWRFAPESPALGIGALWSMLPADTRVPDHSIWEHLRLCSAYAGAASTGGAALLLLSLGPVQGFIAQARSTSDLWAGSHLLSTLAWEAMRVVAERCGPDAILFPDLHGVPVVDLWLAGQGVDFSWMKGTPDRRPSWMRLASDANPLFAAALPNRFMALVPEALAAELAREVETTVRACAKSLAVHAWEEILSLAGKQDGDGLSQIGRQLEGFPEVSWAVVPASLAKEPGALQKALGTFYPHGAERPGFLGSPLYKALSGEHALEGAAFFKPGPGTLYPALYDLAERSHAAAKATRTFTPLDQEGFRCSLCGEREWLTPDRKLLGYHVKDDQPGSPWPAVGKKRPGWAKPGERLCALCCTKRVWPKLFSDRLDTDLKAVAPLLDRELRTGDIHRYVVSTHTMALAPTFRAMAEGRVEDRGKLRKLQDMLTESTHTALPRQLVRQLVEEDLEDVFRRLPAALDDAREGDEATYESLRSLFIGASGSRPETYYGLVLLDGDKMGAWLSGEAEGAPSYEKCFHSRIRSGIRERLGHQHALEGILEARRAPSPAFHGAISRALNGFSLHVARAIVEDVFLGKLIYAGGDDVLAMVAVQDLLPVLLALRCAYAGIALGPTMKDAADGHDPIASIATNVSKELTMRRGYVLRKHRLLRMMGTKATLSAGAVVAHHMTPLGAVLREAREAERTAKGPGGRDAFCLSLIKRSGGVTRVTYGWDIQEKDGVAESIGTTPVAVLLRTRDALQRWLSRRAAYHLMDWLGGLPIVPAGDPDAYGCMLAASIRKVFRRQLEREFRDDLAVAKALEALVTDLVALALRYHAMGKLCPTRGVPGFLQDLLTTAEFLAREQRGTDRKGGSAS